MNLSDFIATRMNSLRQSGRLLLKEREWLLEKERVAVSALHVQEHGDLDIATATRNPDGSIAGLSVGGTNVVPLTRNKNAAVCFPLLIDGALKNTSTAGRIERWYVGAPFSRVRLHIYNVDVTAVSGTYKILAAVTEKAPLTPAEDIWQPIVGGVNQTALRADVGSPGWAPVLFESAETTTVPQAASELLPGVVTSDWLDLASIPRTDGDGYVFMLRYQCTGGARSYHSGLTSATAPKIRYLDAVGEAWFVDHDCFYEVNGGDTTISDLTTVGTTEVRTDIATFAVEFDFDVPAMTILAHGDSITACSSGYVSTYMYSNWVSQAAALASSSEKVFLPVVIAKAGATYAEYSPAGYAALTALRPKLFVHPLWSPNDGNPSATLMGIALANLNTAIANAEAVGATLITWGILPDNTHGLETDNFRKSMNLRAKQMAEKSNAFIYFDTDFMADGGSPANFATGLNYGDGHQNDAGTQLMAEKFAILLKSLPML